MNRSVAQPSYQNSIYNFGPKPEPGAQNTRKVGAHGQVTVAAGARWEEQHQHFNIDEYKPQVRAKLS